MFLEETWMCLGLPSATATGTETKQQEEKKDDLMECEKEQMKMKETQTMEELMTSICYPDSCGTVQYLGLN